MVDTDQLKGIIVSRKLTQKAVYEQMGLTKRQWDARMEKRKLDTDEMYSLCNILDIEEPISVFFASPVT